MSESTINEVFKARVEKYGDRPAVEKKINGRWEQATWYEYYERAGAAGLGLRTLGVSKSDRVSLLSENRLEWLYTDLGALGIGACVVPVYPTLIAQEVQYIVDNSDSKVLVVENKLQLDKALAVREDCPRLEKIVIIDPQGADLGPPFLIAFPELLELGRAGHREDPGLFARLAAAVTPDDLATIVYTSGTTGLPKGAMITHGNIMSEIMSLEQVRPRYGFDTDQTVPFLPLSHVFERVAGHWYGLYVGLTASYAESLDTIVQDIQDKRPTVVLAVPRVCEKIYQKIIEQVEKSPPWKQKVFYWGQGIGDRISRLREEKKPVPAWLRLKYRLAYALVFKKLQQALGGRVRWITASGAPTAQEIIRFFNAAGITVVEGYGMTECTAGATMSNLADHRIGTVGKPLPGVDIKLDEDGEILLKGGNLFKGYWKMEEETRDSFTEDGYFRSGDIGVFKDGFLEIVDRKKDLIITAGGKNIAPQKIENLFKQDPLFSQFIVIGDRRKYLTALVNLNLERAAQLAQDQGLAFIRSEDLLDNQGFLNLVDETVAGLNTRLAKYETIKKYRIVKQEFSMETGELTATLKVKRKVVQQKYADLIDSMYQD